MAILVVKLTGALGVLLPPLLDGWPSVDSTTTTSYPPAMLDSMDGVLNIELSSVSSIGGRPLDTAEGVYSNWLELMDSSELGAQETSDADRDFLLLVELGGGGGGIKNEVGVFKDEVTLLRVLEEEDTGDGKGEGVTLETVVLLTLDSEETMVDVGRAVLLVATERGVDSLTGVDIGLDTMERLARDMVRDCVGVTLLSEEGSSEVPVNSLSASGMDGMMEGVGVPSADVMWGEEADRLEIEADSRAGDANVGTEIEGDTEAGVGERFKGDEIRGTETVEEAEAGVAERLGSDKAIGTDSEDGGEADGVCWLGVCPNGTEIEAVGEVEGVCRLGVGASRGTETEVVGETEGVCRLGVVAP